MVTRFPNYAPSPCHIHPVHNFHHIKSGHPSTCQTIHYDASQYRVYIYSFTTSCLFVISKSQGPRCGLFRALYTVYWPVSSSGYLPWRFPPLLPPPLPPSHHRFLTPSHPTSFHAPSLHPSLYNAQGVCVCVCVRACVCVCVCLASCTEYCVGPSHMWHWDNGMFVPAAGVDSLEGCYLQQTCSHHDFFLTKSKIRWSKRATNTTQTRSTLVPFRGCQCRLTQLSRTGAYSAQR